MPRRKLEEEMLDSVLELKTLALRDDPLVHEYRDVHYQLVIDQLQAAGQQLANETTIAPLSSTRRASLLKQQARLQKHICNKYHIDSFHGGDPVTVNQDRWLETLHLEVNSPLKVETNWRSTFYPPRVQLLTLSQRR